MTEFAIRFDGDSAVELHDVSVHPDSIDGCISFDVAGVVHLDDGQLDCLSGSALEPTEVRFEVVEG